MNDYVRFAGADGMLEIAGSGHYREEYRKCEDGQWRICRLRITRLLGMVDELVRRGVVDQAAVTIPDSRAVGADENLADR